MTSCIQLLILLNKLQHCRPHRLRMRSTQKVNSALHRHDLSVQRPRE